MFSFTNVSSSNTADDFGLPASERSPAISQGEVTVHFFPSLADIKSRQSRKQIKRQFDHVSSVKVIPGAENNLSHMVLQNELVFALRGSSGLTNGTNIAGWTCFSGLTYTTLEDLANQCLYIGTAKNHFNPLSSAAAQHGVAARYKGIATINYVCQPERPVSIYPGEYLMFTIPKYDRRTVPNLGKHSPPEKILPVLEPFSFASLAQQNEHMSRQAYSAKLAHLPLITTAPGSLNPYGLGANSTHNIPALTSGMDHLNPFQRLTQNEKSAVITSLGHVMEILALRGVKIEISDNVFKERHKDFRQIIRSKSKDEITEARKQSYTLLAFLGVVDEDLVVRDENDDDLDEFGGKDSTKRVNEAQKDVFMTAQYPHIPPEAVDLYKPDINYLEFETDMNKKTTRNIRKLQKINQAYTQMCQSAREVRDANRASFVQSIRERCVGMNLTNCNPHVTKPTTDIFITHGAYA